MNPSEISFPTPPVELRLRRSHGQSQTVEQVQAALAENQRRLLEDMEALREREDNLRAYEARLRAMQAQIEQGSVAPVPVRLPSHAPFGDETALSASWNKLHRARELLEVEQRHVRDDRLQLKEEAAALQKREVAVSVREARVTEMEQRLQSKASEKSSSGVLGLTRAPFNLARTVFHKS